MRVLIYVDFFRGNASRMDGRLGFLWLSAHEHVLDAPGLSRHLVQRMIAHAASTSVPLPQRILQRVCVGCCGLLVPGRTCRVSQRQSPRRPRARRRLLLLRCNHCRHLNTCSLPARPSSRAAEAAATEPPSDAQSTKKRRQARVAPRAPSAAEVARQKKAKRKQPNTPHGASATADPAADEKPTGKALPMLPHMSHTILPICHNSCFPL